MKQLWLGGVDESLALLAKQTEPNAVLITISNWQQWLTNDLAGYTSLGDLPDTHKSVWTVIMAADVIHYCPQGRLSSANDLFDETSDAYSLEPLLIYASYNGKKVHGLKNITSQHKTIEEIPQRASPNAQLWTAGCSVTAGVGVDKSQTYGYLLSKALNMPYTNLAVKGSGLTFAADRILRADLNSGDMLVWGVTSWERLSYRKFGTRTNFTASNLPGYEHPEVKRQEIFSENTLHNGITALLQIANYCRKLDIKFVTYNIFPGQSALTRFLHNKTYNIERKLHIKFWKDNSINTPYPDLGHDMQHPGTLSHRKYCKEILDALHLKQMVL